MTFDLKEGTICLEDEEIEALRGGSEGMLKGILLVARTMLSQGSTDKVCVSDRTGAATLDIYRRATLDVPVIQMHPYLEDAGGPRPAVDVDQSLGLPKPFETE